jgi:hypothetical protein
MSLASLFIGGVALIWAVIDYVRHEASIYMALLSVSMVILGIVLFVMGVVLQQGNIIQRELWSIQRFMIRAGNEKGTSDLISGRIAAAEPTSVEL